MIEQKIAEVAEAVNRQTRELADAKARQIRNVMVLEDGRIHTVEDPIKLQNHVDDCKHKLDDMLRYLDGLLKERDGVHAGS